MSKMNHPYHMVNPSPWPILAALGVFITMTGLVNWFHSTTSYLMLLGNILIVSVSIQWWRDVTRESTFQGLHTIPTVYGLKWGMVLFIISEVFFFVSFFWAFFHSSMGPALELGSYWPPMSVTPLNPFQVPLLNTAILLSSGISVTWAHHALMEANYTQAKNALVITVILGLYFTLLQAFEYKEASFSISDATFGSTFFMATGFHGLHVIIGTTFLAIALARHNNFHFSSSHHLGFETATWYWHFVDVVWLFLFLSIYWWGS
uniref:Cytochrome c oxidase subunit 3 n=1 Tax=Bothropolys sp. SP-2004 TaxID=292347 RepID=A5D6J5_9MYRI|nr:cytochrome c oxidase subunit III [Bothropolys sp. SP-2004]